jgi:8-oxo-dGTP diphosphatase
LGDRWQGCGSFPAARSRPGKHPKRRWLGKLGIEVCLTCLAPFTFASFAYPEFHLLMPLFLCRNWEGEITPREGQRIQWVRAMRLADYPMPPADLPLLPFLRDLLG